MAVRPDPPPLSTATLDPGLYVVATPIGALRDITLHALDVLAGADLVLAEDTRVTAKLLSAYGLTNRLERYDDHSGVQARPRILSALADGARIAICSDAGTPLVSDPGFRLVQAAIAQGSTVIPVPGPSSVMAALSAAGLPTDRFLFAGFAPPRTAGRRALFAELAPVRASLVFFESGARLAASLADMAEVLGPREAVVARELTKLHESFYRGRLDALAAAPELARPKGEIVIVVSPGEAQAASLEDADAALAEALGRVSPAHAAAEVARALGLDRRALYKRALALKATW